MRSGEIPALALAFAAALALVFLALILSVIQLFA